MAIKRVKNPESFGALDIALKAMTVAVGPGARGVALAMLASLPLLAGQAKAPSPAVTPMLKGIVEQPCPPPLLVPAIVMAERQAGFDPKAPSPRAEAVESLDVVRWYEARAERAKTDWANLCRYRADNAALSRRAPPKVVFIGDSITELWLDADPAFFGPGMIDRGISGQTSQQILARFYQDVVELRPQAVHIMAGTNDVAGNLGPSRARDVINNIAAMVDIAKANHIAVVLGSIPPVAEFDWVPGLVPASKIAALNTELRALAVRRGVIFANYHAAMVGSDGGMRAGISSDGVHPNRKGYAIMEPLASSDLKKALHAPR